MHAHTGYSHSIQNIKGSDMERRQRMHTSNGHKLMKKLRWDKLSDAVIETMLYSLVLEGLPNPPRQLPARLYLERVEVCSF
jgi:hypothetical protein